jgi:hypothetical protein
MPLIFERHATARLHRRRMLFLVFCGVRDAVLEIFSLGEEIVEPLLDLLQDVGSGSSHVFVAELDDHLSDPRDRANSMDRIVLT